ncbi:MAG: hypothetical protein ACE5MM_06895 [Nitrospiraceae bacterium]
MRARKILFTTLVQLALVGTALAAETYVVDPDHSDVSFSVRHISITSSGI